MNMKFLIILAMLLIGMNGCSKWLEDEELTLPKTPYTGNELRTDGYYYYTMNGEYFRTITFFYKNGVAFRPPSGSHSLQEVDEYVINELVGANLFHGS